MDQEVEDLDRGSTGQLGEDGIQQEPVLPFHAVGVVLHGFRGKGQAEAGPRRRPSG